MKWRAPLFVGLFAFIVAIMGCTNLPIVLSPSSPTPDRVATRVAEDQAVAATLTAAAPKPVATFPPPPTSPPSSLVTLPPITLPTLPPFSSSVSSSFASASSSSVAPLPRYMLIARHNKGCLLGGGIGLGGCNGAANQMWQVDMVDAQFAQISQSGMCLTTKGGPNDDGAPLTQSSCARQDNQLWRLDKYGDWVQLVNKYSGKCVDAQQFGYDSIFQWNCKRGNADNNINDNDNQLWLRSTASSVASSVTPPPGVYVTSIEPEFGQPAPAKREYAFKVTFANTVGAPQPYRWWVMLKNLNGGQGSGETPKKNELLGSGVFKTELWTIGRGCANYSAQVFWWRDYAEPHEVPFRDTLGQQPKITFNVCF